MLAPKTERVCLQPFRLSLSSCDWIATRAFCCFLCFCCAKDKQPVSAMLKRNRERGWKEFNYQESLFCVGCDCFLWYSNFSFPMQARCFYLSGWNSSSKLQREKERLYCSICKQSWRCVWQSGSSSWKPMMDFLSAESVLWPFPCTSSS